MNFIYEITEDGEVFSVNANWRGYGKRKLFAYKNKYGYLFVRVQINGKREVKRIHKWMAEVYLPPRPSKHHQIRHLDGNKQNNHKDNLKWGTAKENAEDRAVHGKTSRGANHVLSVTKGIHAYLRNGGKLGPKSRRISVTDIENDIIKEYDSVVTFSKLSGMDRDNLYRYCKYEKIVKGFKYKYL